MSLSRADLLKYESLVSGLRVNELQSILIVFNLPKLGKKQELIHRCVSLLHSPTSQLKFVSTVDDLMRRAAPARPAPYPQQLVQSRRMNNGYTAPTQNYNHNVMPPKQNSLRLVKGLRPMVLPFYDLIATLVEPVELPPLMGAIKTVKNLISFGLSASDILEFKDKREKDLPRLELQLRFFNITGDYQAQEQVDDFPLNCFVRLDDQVVVLPNVIPTNKPNAEPKRPSRPVNITQYCCPPRPINVPHTLSVEWSADRRTWACGIYKVRRVTSQILFDRANENSAVRLTSEITKQTIIRRLSGDDDGISLSQIKVSLLCPLGKIRMILPARGRECTHLQCFDLKLFLDMNEKRPTWKCAVCSGPCHYNNLIIDGYFEDVLNSVDRNVTEVELLRDGGYRTIKEEVQDLSSSDDNAEDIVSLEGPSTSTKTNHKPISVTNPTVVSKPKPEDDIITLSDSDDDDVDMQRAVQNSVAIMSAIEPSKQNYPSSPCSSDNSVIILDDTPPRPVQRPTISQSIIPGPSNPNNIPMSSSKFPVRQIVQPVSAPHSSSVPLPPPMPPAVTAAPTMGGNSIPPHRLNMTFEQPMFRMTQVNAPNNFFGMPGQNAMNRLPGIWSNGTGMPPNSMSFQHVPPPNSFIGRQQQFPSAYGYRAPPQPPPPPPSERYDTGRMNLAQALQSLQNDPSYAPDFRNK